MATWSASPIRRWSGAGRSACSTGNDYNPDMQPDLPELLGHLPFFAGLWDRGLEWVARTLKERAATAGSDVFREGDPGCSLFVVKDGELAAMKGGHQLMRLGAG